jgi:hypothetical protein
MSKTPNRTMRIPDDPWEPAQARAAERGETVTEQVVKFLRRYAHRKDGGKDE